MPVFLVLDVRLQVAHLAQEAPLEEHPLVAARGGHHEAVAAVARPAQRGREGVGLVAIQRAVVEPGQGQPHRGAEFGALPADPQEHGVVFRERHAEAHRRARGLQLVAVAQVVDRATGAVEGVDRQRDAVHGPVGIDRADHQRAVVLAGVHLDAQAVARAEGVVLLDRCVEGQLLGAGVARPEGQVAGRLLGDVDDQVHLVRGAGHLVGLDLDILEVAQPVDAFLRELDQPAVVPGRFELAELPADDLVPGARVARHVDAAHISPALRLGGQHHGHLAGGAVDLGPGLDAREGITIQAEQVLEAARRCGDGVAAVGLAGPQQHEGTELFFLAQVVAFQAHAGDGVGLAFLDRDGDRDRLLVGRDRDLRRLDRKFQVAAVEVVRAQLFQVGVQLGARVAIGLAVPGEPARGRQLEEVLQRGLRHELGADDAHIADARGVALGHREGDVDAVALQRRHGRHDLGAIQAAAEVLALDLLLGAIDRRAVERQAVTDAGVPQALRERVLVEFLQAHEGHGSNDRTLVDDEHGDLLLDLDAHVLEETRGEQRAQGAGPLVVGVGVTDAEGQGREDRAGVGALKALDPDVLDDERLDSPGRRKRRS